MCQAVNISGGVPSILRSERVFGQDRELAELGDLSFMPTKEVLVCPHPWPEMEGGRETTERLFSHSCYRSRFSEGDPVGPVHLLML